MKKRILTVLLALCLAAGFAGCGMKRSEAKQRVIKFADVGWDSIRFHNAFAGLIAKRVFGYEWEEVSGTSVIAHEALKTGEIDVEMEAWTANLPDYAGDVENGLITELGVNFDDNAQGFYVPRYVIEGDAERGIEPMAPDLKSVADLTNYAALFPDPEVPGKARVYGGIPGWEITEIMRRKVSYYGLDALYSYVEPGTDSAMNAALVQAYDRGEAIVAYYWEPTWLMGMYDFVLLEDAPYDESIYQSGGCECPSVRTTVCASNAFAAQFPEFCEFLSKYHTSSALTSDALGYMQETGADYRATAEWFLAEHRELVESWLTPEQVALLDGEATAETANPFFTFPTVLKPDTVKIDNAVRGFASSHEAGLGAISGALLRFVIGIETVLKYIPWFVLLLAVGLLGWRSRRSIGKGLLYAALLSLIGLAGLWELMNTTLAIVIASVLLSLLFGLPLGMVLSLSDRANRIARPVLDTMQTMPVFVYLIPALLLFGMGYAPAVIATVIYAIVPVIRMTSLGIRQVDKEVAEAAKAFGSTGMQTLFKVQIPQAMPTIMAGVNQTLMMAMSMVVTCSMIGARGLGHEVLIAVQRMEIGRGVIAGSAVVIIAVLLDRLTQGWFGKGGK